MPSVENALNAVSPHARAKINLRVHPAQDAAEAQAALVRHLEARAAVRDRARRSTPEETGNGFAADTTGPAYDGGARGDGGRVGTPDRSSAAGGGSIPLVSALHAAVPDAEVLLVGATDGYANIHAPDERVLLDELEKAGRRRGRRSSARSPRSWSSDA